jgi:hypothetical protein
MSELELEKSEDLNLEWHEKIAKDCFNKTWDFLDKKDLTPDEITEMIHTVHTSRYHWGVLVANGKGEPVNIQRGDWLIAHVYTILESKEPALHYANLCLNFTKKYHIGGFDLGFAYEGVARAYALTGDKENFEKYYKLAEGVAKNIDDKGDRDYFEGELKGGNWFGMK